MTMLAIEPSLDVLFKTIEVDGLNIFYREAGEETAPKLVLLHGFPSSSHQYRNLTPALAKHFHVIAPDYPGFGNSDVPDPATFGYTSRLEVQDASGAWVSVLLVLQVVPYYMTGFEAVPKCAEEAQEKMVGFKD